MNKRFLQQTGILLLLLTLLLSGCQSGPNSTAAVSTQQSDAPVGVTPTVDARAAGSSISVKDVNGSQTTLMLDEIDGLETKELEIEGTSYEGYNLPEIIETVLTDTDANQITLTADDGYAVSLPLEDVINCTKCFLAVDKENQLSSIMPDFEKKTWVNGLASLSFEVTELTADESQLYVDGLGREITLDGPAVSVVSLAPSNTEILYAIGAGDLIVGRDDFSDYPAEVLDVTSIGGYSEYNFEQLVSLQPDLVLAAEINANEDIKAIEDLGINVYYISNPLDFEGLYENLRVVGLLTGHSTEAETLIEKLTAEVELIDTVTAGISETPLVFYEIDATDPAKPWTVGAGTYHDMLISRAKGVNLGSQLEGMYPQVSQEELIVQNPEIILLSDSMWGVTAESVAERPGWEAVSAVVNERVLPFDGNLLDRPGPRLVEGYAELVRLIHPEAADQLP